jgi:hypothetical protein
MTPLSAFIEPLKEPAVTERYKEQREVTEREHQADLEATKKRVEDLKLGIKPQVPKVPLDTKLWAWGVNSEKHPTYAIGVFPMIFMYVIVVPILGILCKLSFGILVPIVIVGAEVIALIAKLFKH